MNDKLSYLKRGKNLLLSVKKQREWLIKHEQGYITGELVDTELKNIEFALSKIKSADQMRAYLQRKERHLFYLISSKNRKSQQELRELIENQLIS